MLPPYQEAHKYVAEQREEQFEDLKHTLKIMGKLNSDTDCLAEQFCMMLLLEEGGMSFVKVPNVSF